MDNTSERIKHMKVTIQLDEAAALSPREVRVIHELPEQRRRFSRQLAQCELGEVVVVRASGFGQTLGELFERKGAAR